MSDRKAVWITAAGIAGAALVAGGTIIAAGQAATRRRREQIRGKVVVITGGSRGLGLALAEEFAAMGARTALAATDADELHRAKERLAAKVNMDSDQILTVKSDLRDAAQARSLVEWVTEFFGSVDILINNAGIITVGPIENQTVESFREVMDTNFFSSVHCSLAALPQMLERRSGIIVNVASIGGKVAVPHLLPYTASKFAQVGFSEGLHAELRGKGIHVLTVCPGLMRTGSHLNALFSGNRAREYRWFSLLATTPGISVSARHAARRIVRGIVNKETEIVISPQAALAARLAPVMPGMTALMMGLMTKFLPSPVELGERTRKGWKSRQREPLPARTIGVSAAERYNQAG
jgi:NAD(P)-dependent dehydrogenase (short-subunit alcohol dehydrogenase family)